MSEESLEPEEEESEAARARSYDADIRTAMPGYELLHETAAALLQEELREGAHVLAVGSGTGEEVVRSGSGNPTWRFTAIDPSAAMLEVARERISAAGMADRVELREGYVHDLPGTESYDAATLLLVQHFLPDDGAKLDLLRAVAARLKPGAPVILANMHGDLDDPPSRRLYNAWKRRQIARGMPVADADAMFTGLPEVIHFVSEERIRELPRQAGFTDIEPVFRGFVIGGWLARKDAAN